MKKLNTLSYLFLVIAGISLIVQYKFITSNFFYDNFLNITSLAIIISPIIGLILAQRGKRKNQQGSKLSMMLNGAFIMLFVPLTLLNFLLINFKK
jgi:hypothetical protein